MNKQETMEIIKKLGILAVIRGPSEEDTINAVDALVEGGILGIEVTFSTPNAGVVVSKLSRRYGEQIMLGMGTLTSKEQVRIAIESGAKFIVSPMLDEKLVEEFVNSGLLSMVGCFSPSEVFHAYQMGADIIKIFPAQLAGPSYVKDLRGPFPEIPFMPTGGVDKSNLADWFRVGVIAVGAGSSLCPKELIIKKEYKKITEIAKEFNLALKSAR